MNYLHVPAPAKVNLILYVLGKRKDGYHNLVSLFHRISLCDEILIRRRKSSGLDLKISGAELPKGKNNLIGKAYEALCDVINARPGLSVLLRKKIPVGSGLGGGSSDVASFLLASNVLLKLKLPFRRLFEIGTRVGADVPFFLKDTVSCLAEGRGEKLMTLPCGVDYFFLNVTFSKSFPTKEMYQSLDQKFQQPVSLTKVRSNVKLLSSFLDQGKLGEGKSFFHNDFQQIAKEKLNLIGTLIDLWRKEGIPGLLAGSGSSIFAVFNDAHKLKETARRLTHYRDVNVFQTQSYRASILAQVREELLP